MTARFERTFTAGAEHIDELGHVNNAGWGQWVQDMGTQTFNHVTPSTPVIHPSTHLSSL